MPYVVCDGCGTRTYAVRSYALAAECAECGTRLLDPRLVPRGAMRPSPPPPSPAVARTSDAVAQSS